MVALETCKASQSASNGSHLEKFPASLAEKGKGVPPPPAPPACRRLSKQLKVPDEEGGRKSDWRRGESLFPCMSTPAGRVLFWGGGGGMYLFFACAKWLTGVCVIPYKCKYFSFSCYLSLPHSSPSLNPFSFHLPPSPSRSSLSLSTFVLFLLFGY